MFDSLQKHLSSTFSRLTGRGSLSEKDITIALKEISDAFIEADVSYEVVQNFTKKIKEKALGKEVLRSIKPGQMVVKIVHDALVEMLGSERKTLDLNAPAPVVMMMVGLQGSGKTTTTTKIAYHLTKRQNKKVLMASLDTYRPAAQEQLQQLGEQANIKTLPIIEKQNPLEITQRAIHTAKTEAYDVLILDTAGRTNMDEASMSELLEIKKKALPHETLLVVDSLTGQNAIDLARGFDTRIDISGIILTRMDSDARGGAALSVRAVTGKPIKLIGVGEKIDALEEFHPKRMADRILDMGDIVSLVEKAQENIDIEQIKNLSQKLKSGRFDMNDLASQLKQMQKMGGMRQIMSMIPGAAKIQEKMAAAQFDDKTINRQLAIISSMTHSERLNPEILKHSRKQRIAAGSGTHAMEINKLIKMHRTMADAMKNPKGLSLMQEFFKGKSSTEAKGSPSLDNFLQDSFGKNLPSFDEMQKYMKDTPSKGFLNDILKQTIKKK